MPAVYTVTLQKIINELGLRVEHLPQSAEEIPVCTCDVNRPGLAFGGYFDYFDADRIQVIGFSEYGYLERLSDELRAQRIAQFVAQKPVAVIVARDLQVFPELKEQCVLQGVPLLCTSEPTSSCLAALIAFLNVQLAPRITRHGVLVEVYGEGILLTGDSGIGKSETAIELVKRGHRLIADDAVEIRRVSSKTLVGASPANIRHFIELRGVGIVNARRIFGMGAVKLTEKIDMVIQMEPWDSERVYDRMGLENEQMELLGISVPKLTIPIKPGRNLAIIIEVAAMNNRQKKMGYNAAEELMRSLGMGDSIEHKGPPVNWDLF